MPARNIKGEAITHENMGSLVGSHITGRMTMSMRKTEGEIVDVWFRDDDIIMSKVQFDNGEVERMQLSGKGRCAFWEMPSPQLPLARRSGCQAVSLLHASGPPPIAKFDLLRMTPMHVLPYNHMLGNTAAIKALGCAACIMHVMSVRVSACQCAYNACQCASVHVSARIMHVVRV